MGRPLQHRPFPTTRPSCPHLLEAASLADVAEVTLQPVVVEEGGETSMNAIFSVANAHHPWPPLCHHCHHNGGIATFPARDASQNAEMRDVRMSVVKRTGGQIGQTASVTLIGRRDEISRHQGLNNGHRRRLALLEKAGADLTVRRPSAAQNMQPPREARRDVPDTPSYLNGRAETMANRYNQRGSSPLNAPAVPAFTLSFAPSAPQPFAATGAYQIPVAAASPDMQSVSRSMQADSARIISTERLEPPANAPTAPKAPPSAPKVELAEPPPSAPKAPRALEVDALQGAGSRLHGVRSLETLNLPGPSDGTHGTQRANPFARPFSTGLMPLAPAHHFQAPPTLGLPISPNAQTTRFGELAAPTGPRATRMSPAQTSVSPRPPFASPQSDTGGFPGFPGFPGYLAGQTPPPSAPSGPRNRSFSVSPKVATSSVPTAPKGNRVPPMAPRAGERMLTAQGRAPDRLGAPPPPPWAPPSAPRSLQWNQWRRPGAPMYVDKTVPAKRDFAGEEKDWQPETASRRGMLQPDMRFAGPAMPSNAIAEPVDSQNPTLPARNDHGEDRMDVDAPSEQHSRQPQVSGPSAAQSFFGQPLQSTEDDHAMSDAQEEQLTSSEDDEIDPEEDHALFVAKFERQKRLLESQLTDLGAREYRATTPLESIARLNRIEPNDLQRVQEQQEMEIDEPPPTENNLLVPPTTHSSGSDDGPEIVTPIGEETTTVEVRSDNENNEGSTENARRPRLSSPEVVLLPYLVKDAEPFVEGEDYQMKMTRQQDTQTAVSAALQDEAEEEAVADAEGDSTFRGFFRQWREECEILDREREALEKLERQQSVEPGPEVDVPAALPGNPVMEGRRLLKFSSEYEFERVIKQSEETARLEQERKDRETQKAQADMGKEAKIPDQQRQAHFKRGVFIDTNRLRDPAKLTLAFSYEPQPDTFTEDEQRIFIASFRETPKKWGEIASLLPGRSYKDCIHHYYANKWDGRFRDNRTRKLKGGGRRGRGGKAPPRGRGAALMADLGRTEEVVPVPNVSDSGRPKRAAAPTTFGERELDAKAAMAGPSPAKRPGLGGRQDTTGEAGSEKPVKRRRGPGESKPGRKAKAQQPLAALAAAPAASPSIPVLHSMPNGEEVSRAQSIEDATLLAGLQSGHHSMPPGDAQLIYHQQQQEVFGPPMLKEEDMARSKVVGQTASSKSSYWSVPEQTDFAKYIAHFGTDFAAIAAHMGTKTQTMIKNHYTRQVDSGNRPELHVHAVEADRRREAGEDMGPPPTPTPIVKRKYDNPTQPTAPRPLAPNTEAMEVDEPPMPPRAPPQPKHVSPPQVQAQPRFTPSAHATPVPAHRVMPSPIPSTVSPAMPRAQPTPIARPMQHPLGQRLAFLSDTRPESRPGLSATSSFRLGQDTPPRSQPQQPTPNPVSVNFIRNLMQEQGRALRMQEQSGQQEPSDQVPRQPSRSSVHRGSAQGSPAVQPLQPPLERKLLAEERATTPPRSNFVQSPFSRPPFTQTTFEPLASAPLAASFMGRAAFNTSLPKREDQRPSSVPALPPAPPPMAPAAPPEPPKRSNLMSILNMDADEPRPPKRENLLTGPPRVASPAPSGFPGSSTPAPQSNALPTRSETFGQPSMPQSHFHRTSFGPQSKTPAPVPPAQTVKRETSVSGSSSTQASRADWANHAIAKPTQPAQPAQPKLERDARPYLSHRTSVLGALNQPTRANPSPPPHPVTGHSRTPSLTTQPHQPPPREQHAVVPGQHPQHGHRGPVQPLHSNPYAQQPTVPPFSQAPPQQVQSHAHHSHNSSLGGGFPGMHHRGPSRDDHVRQQQADQEIAARRRDELEWRRRQEQEVRERMPERQMHESEIQEMERQRAEQFYMQQRFHQQQAFGHGPPPPQQVLHQAAFNGPAFGQQRAGVGLRDQALRETEAAMLEEQRRIQQQQQQQQQQQRQHGEDRMHYEAAMRDQERQEMDFRRRQQDAAMFARRTPLGNGFGHPPPQPPRR
ncbi:hypothetical protein LTR08_004416 [Meristemomyces frigidus]|nr:hypothetical protein LTR08_004416 [Meristemomyces frigidus]